MTALDFPAHLNDQTHVILNINDTLDARATLGQRAADGVAKVMGSWRFIIVQTVLLSLWIALNVTAYVNHWDPYPFILMNLVLSMQAAYAAPVIMMSQNRQADRDRVAAHNDYLINVKAEVEVRAILEHLEAQSAALGQIQVDLKGRDVVTGSLPHLPE